MSRVTDWAETKDVLVVVMLVLVMCTALAVLAEGTLQVERRTVSVWKGELLAAFADTQAGLMLFAA